MKILFIWTGLTSYMGDCWRELARRPEVELRVIVDVSSAAAQAVAFRADEVMRGLDYELVGQNAADLHLSTFNFQPDIIFAVGWHSALCRAVVCDARFAGVPKVCCFDMPWRWKLRCLVAPLVLGRFLRHYDAAFVPGEVCARYARWLGFRRVYKGLFGIDTERFRDEVKVEGEGEQRNYFLYIGRNSSEKRLGDIRAAHALYRKAGGRLALRLYGKGLEGGFVRPDEVPRLMHGAAAFVLASDFDPWPLVLVEAMSAGCPVIASDRCTNRPELGRNWRVFRTGDVAALARVMGETERLDESRLRIEREENLALARQYDARLWPERVMGIAGDFGRGEMERGRKKEEKMKKCWKGD